MARKGTAGGHASSATHSPPCALWRVHLDSIKRFHAFPPMPRQARDVVLVDPRSANAALGQPVAFSMRQAATQFKLTGTLVEEPVEDIVRTIPILKPSPAVVEALHEVALLTAEYYALLGIKKRCVLSSEAK